MAREDDSDPGVQWVGSVTFSTEIIGFTATGRAPWEGNVTHCGLWTSVESPPLWVVEIQQLMWSLRPNSLAGSEAGIAKCGVNMIQGLLDGSLVHKG